MSNKKGYTWQELVVIFLIWALGIYMAMTVIDRLNTKKDQLLRTKFICSPITNVVNLIETNKLNISLEPLCNDLNKDRIFNQMISIYPELQKYTTNLDYFNMIKVEQMSQYDKIFPSNKEKEVVLYFKLLSDWTLKLKNNNN